MFLRSLHLRGFKSFADRTTLEFAPGLSVIVGPNGSGKSNLVDAISWVLGEQGPRALRGAQMADVIFAGSPNRPGLGMAEVSLVIDNTAGLIPVDASELEISRVVYRSGESQYLIAGQPVRLMDIQELLSDTGVGRAQHVVVGQGQLEDILTARPEERRRFIEEAAGIAKHRRRKERAQRKLAGLEHDLLRLQDVMTELRRQLRPLKQQAEAAGKHEKLAAEAADLARRLAAARLRHLYALREGRSSAWEEGRTRRAEAERRLAELDARIAALGDALVEAERELGEAEGRESDAAGARSEAEAALREAVRHEAEARARVAAEAGREARLFTLEEETRRSETDLGEIAAALEEKEAALAQAERAFAQAADRRREAEEARRDARERALARRAEAQALRRSLEIGREEQGRLSAVLEDARGREAEAVAERERLEAEVERLDAEETPVADRQARLGKESERFRAELAESERRVRDLETRRQALDARARVLRDSAGKRFLRTRPGRAAGLLAGLIEVEPGHEKAVAAALGSLADAVVYEDHGRAVADAAGSTGATLAVADEERGGGFVLPGERLLSSVVHPDPRAAAVVGAALRHIYLTGNAEEALAKHRRHPGASFVTPEGLLVGPAVVRTAPAPTEEQLSVRREDVVLERDLNRARKDLRAAEAAVARVDAQRAEVEEALGRTDALITAAADRMSRLDADLAALGRERDLLEERLLRVEETVRAAAAGLEEMPGDGRDQGPELPPVPEPPIELRVEIESLRRDRRRLERTLEGRRAETNRLRAEDPASLMEAADRATEERERAEAALREAEAGAAQTAAHREDAARRASEVRAAEADANRSWREAASELQRVRDRYEDEEQARREIVRRVEEAERVLRDGHQAEPAEAAAALGSEDTVDALQKRSDLVARRLALLGRVNLVAGEEYKALQDRHDFLDREIADVKAARRDLQQVVREVDAKIQDIFDAAYRDVAAEFTSVFATLFPEGEGKLTLTDPGDLLGTGIEIEARPGRKRVKRITLLSGGERALAALAFLFAIFKARPSPFYVLDEVEAALDDINLHRFIELVQEFARTSQVIVVTHQKRTMEAAEALYGVSLARDGSSAVISQRVADAVTASRG
jgi:chromosome segregation protein